MPNCSTLWAIKVSKRIRENLSEIHQRSLAFLEDLGVIVRSTTSIFINWYQIAWWWISHGWFGSGKVFSIKNSKCHKLGMRFNFDLNFGSFLSSILVSSFGSMIFWFWLVKLHFIWCDLINFWKKKSAPIWAPKFSSPLFKIFDQFHFYFTKSW